MRRKTWHTLLLSSLIFSIGFVLLVGSQQEVTPNMSLCLVQVALIHSTPTFVAFATLSYSTDIYISIRRMFESDDWEDGPEPQDVVILVLMPWIAFLLLFMTVILLVGLPQNTAHVADPHFYCHTPSTPAVVISAATLIVAMLSAIMLQAATGWSLYHNWIKLQNVSVTSTARRYLNAFVRTITFTALGIIALTFGLVALMTINKQLIGFSMLLPLFPIGAALIFGTYQLFLLSSIPLVVLLFYTVEIPYESVRVHQASLKAATLPLLRQVLPKELPYRIQWPSLFSAPTPDKSSPSPDEHPQSSTERTKDSSRAKFTRHVVAVGDLHGDLGNARRVLQFSGVTDDKGDWSGNVDFFVQTGDIIDRGDDTIALYAWMDRLREQASAVGATVMSLLGNHEWMNAIGDWRYVYPSELATFGSITARQKQLSTGKIGRSWARNYTTAARLPLHPHIGLPNTPFPPTHARHLHFQKDRDDEGAELDNSVYYDEDEPLSHAALSFVHGGLSPTYPDLVPFPKRINEIAKVFLRKLQYREQPLPHPPSRYPGMPQDTSLDEIHMYDANGPVWYRGWALGDEETVCEEVESVLARTGTRRMIMGHTPDFNNIVSRCNGKIIIIDTGISHAYGGVLSALSIHYTLEPIGEPEGKRWLETEVVSALYPDRRDVLAIDEREIVGDFIV
ncbi:hypothetical protein NP233_g6342 [Leucocoprinus birnbaumii]|uniref:Calcineurin-like phosphoesterase domain-containing protein n=1 Tax=Leucocoprinus birnbaumii TaxID=56174 RepID=A0AAD5VR65_9AGAR|nr:hypothetical protein NP233_g6342 [Leucocoprinus birnbaumii]